MKQEKKNKKIPNIKCVKDHDFSIDVQNFSQLYKKLNSVENHDPFSYHKPQFYLILDDTKSSYEHFLDFKSYSLNYHGTGLGLSICKKIMSKHNGSISISKTSDAGTSFLLSFENPIANKI